MRELMQALNGFWNDEEGATAVEYGVMVALIIAVLIVTIALIGDKLLVAFETVDTELGNAS